MTDTELEKIAREMARACAVSIKAQEEIEVSDIDGPRVTKYGVAIMGDCILAALKSVQLAGQQRIEVLEGAMQKSRSLLCRAFGQARAIRIAEGNSTPKLLEFDIGEFADELNAAISPTETTPPSEEQKNA